MIVKSAKFSDGELARFRDLQRLSFSILEETAAGLEEGVTEKDVTKKLMRRYRDAGVRAFFHLPVALFGERAALPGDWRIGNFYPKSSALKRGDSVILDASPLFGGFMVDTSYSCAFGENDAHRKMMSDLGRYRSSVCDAVNEGAHFAAVAADVEADMKERGYEPVHTKHPGEVLGHRAIKTAIPPVKWRINGFDGLSLSWFLIKSRAAAAGVGKRDPLWNARATSDHSPHDGLWLVEPHAGANGVGAKWEEILVVENGRAHWLDDEPPHVRQWRAIAAGENYSPSVGAVN